VLIITNFERFPRSWVASDGTTGQSEFARSAAEFLAFRNDPRSVFMINCDTRLTLDLARRQLVPFAPRRPIIAVDLVLRRPRSLPQRLAGLGKRFLFSRVDTFVHYFKDHSAIDAAYGIGGRRGAFIPFKANIWNLRSDGARPDGEYVVCFGRSMRDFDTFFAAMERVAYPGAISDPAAAAVWTHGSRFSRPLDKLPPNVRIVPDDMSNESQAQVLGRAKLVVVPLIKGSLVASGISTILNAMALGKCVIASAGAGPGVTDIFDRELLSVPAEDPAALAAMIERAWTDDGLRRRTAQAGWEYARRCGSEQDLFQRLIDFVAERRARLTGP
jgi:glycosyltransferase involved in cell wall biosynthesis